MKKKWVMSFLMLLLITATALAGCSNSDKTAKSESGKEEGTKVTKTNKDPLVLAVTGDPQSWDPIDTFLIDWVTIGTSVFEGLVDRNLDLEIKPGLAESWEFLDDKTLQFKLRKGVTFHNGEPFNAEAVKFTYDRLLGEEGAKGPQQSNYNSIENVEIIDEFTVNFNLKTPDPVLITKLAGYGGVIVPPKYIQEKGVEHFRTNPVGTGPFKWAGYEKDSKVELVKNENYWKEGLPKLEKVTFRIIPEATTRLAELQTGTIDIMKQVEISQAKTVEKLGSVSLETVSTPTVQSIRFDTSKKPIDDIRVREAISLAIDVDTIIETVLNGHGKRITTFQADMSFGHNPDLKLRPYDPEKAKELLKEAGVKEGTELDLFFGGNDSTFKEVAQAVQFYLNEVGLKVNLNPVDSTTYFSDLIPNAKSGHMYSMGWGGWTLDFDMTSYLLYNSGEFWNPTFKDEKVEELLKAQRSTFDQAEREVIFKELTTRLYELMPDIPLWQRENLWGVGKHVKGFVPAVDDRLRLEEVSFE